MKEKMRWDWDTDPNSDPFTTLLIRDKEKDYGFPIYLNELDSTENIVDILNSYDAEVVETSQDHNVELIHENCVLCPNCKSITEVFSGETLNWYKVKCIVCDETGVIDWVRRAVIGRD